MTQNYIKFLKVVLVTSAILNIPLFNRISTAISPWANKLPDPQRTEIITAIRMAVKNALNFKSKIYN